MFHLIKIVAMSQIIIDDNFPPKTIVEQKPRFNDSLVHGVA